VKRNDKPQPSCEQIIDMLPGPFVILDRDYHIIAANRRYQEQYGVGADEVIGRHCYEVSHHSIAPCSQHGEHCPLEEVFTTRKSTQVMHIHYGVDNQEEYVQLQASPILSKDGEVLYIGEYVQIVNGAGVDDSILVGRSPAFLRMTSLLQRVAPTASTVLLLGESGVGKERVAEYIHHYSERRDRPFVVVDCGTLGESLIESELFGYEKGAFTGAHSRKLGLFEAAHGGTLFIDEICELPLSLQTKLLRALESGTVRRIGGREYIHVDVRVIAATNRDVKRMVADGEFRQDLYYRLSAFPVRIPALREHKDDIAALARHFLTQFPEGERHIPLSSEVIEKLLSHDYPGNIRELRNIIERATILAYDDILKPDHIVIEQQTPPSANSDLVDSATLSRTHLVQRRGRLTDARILEVLEQTQGHRGSAARILGVSERTLYRHIRKLRS